MARTLDIDKSVKVLEIIKYDNVMLGLRSEIEEKRKEYM